MPQLFLCQNFPSPDYSHLLTRMTANIDKREFTKSLITVGYPSKRKARTTVGIWRARMLKNMVAGYLNDNLSLTNYFVNLEGSEKATVSFLFAQALTHWFAQNHMNIYYLVHVIGADESYDSSGAMVTLKRGSAAPQKK